ncbi:MAG TPA: AAA family ATPase [Microlunatus sp.]
MTAVDERFATATQETDTDWAAGNQRYLTAALEVIRCRLLTKDPADALAALERAARAVDPPPAIEVCATAFQLSPFERDVLLLCAGMQLDGAFARACADAQGDPGSPGPTFSLAMATLPEPHWSAITPAAPLRRWHLVEPGRSGSPTTGPLHIDEQVLHSLTGIYYLDPRLAVLRSGAPAPGGAVPAMEPVSRRIGQQWASAYEKRIVLHGGRRCDARLAVAAAAERLGLQPLFLATRGLPADPEYGELLARLCERDTALAGHCWVLDVGDGPSGSLWPALEFAARLLAPVAVITAEPVDPDQTDIAQMAVPTTPVDQLRSRWKDALGPSGARLENWVDQLAGQFRVGLNDVDGVVASVAASGGLQREDTGPRLWAACRALARPSLDQLAQRIDARPDWSDLVLPESQLRLLRQVAVHVRHRMTVFEDWRFGRRTSRGAGVAALLHGPSGTGKTFAAEVLAAELSLDLYRVDLSQVISKYIGETEKNLRQIFDAAEAGGVVLLFDEADALFGKRSEVKDSHDRYANVEVSYLLQRIETFSGLAILTTNLKSALDTAFLRRLRFVVSFPFPDATARAAIWRGMFPPEMPTENLRAEKLARLGVAGGTIRNIALAAAFLAADAREPVRMTHLAQAARMEYAKLERPLADKEVSGWT